MVKQQFDPWQRAREKTFGYSIVFLFRHLFDDKVQSTHMRTTGIAKTKAEERWKK